jgi:hypothetical protein
MQEAKPHLDRLAEEAASGDAFLICKASRAAEGQCSVPDDFDHLDSEAIADLFEGA